MSSTPPQAGDGTPSPNVLVTSRVSDPMQSPAGFAEVYWCDECCDYFVLAWQGGAEDLPPRCQRVALPKGPAGQVFCPTCSVFYPDYGKVLRFGAPAEAS